MTSSGNNWYHCVISTYGTWIRGDTRGWRSRHHREHVQGDYKNPPPADAFEVERLQSRQQMTRPEIVFTPSEREIICHLIADYLSQKQVPFAEYCVSATHVHLLAQISSETMKYFPRLPRISALSDGRNPFPRHLLGRLKAHTTFTMRQKGLCPPRGGLWSLRSKVIPIKDRNHQLNVAQYIRDHVHEGAVVWSLWKQRMNTP